MESIQRRNVKNFNPRSLAGATRWVTEVIGRRFISIHAPLRERQVPKNFYKFINRFQSTLPCGSDGMTLVSYNNDSEFQSTLPCGSDCLREGRPYGRPNFNPRSLAGATDFLAFAYGNAVYFNPRSLAGAT